MRTKPALLAAVLFLVAGAGVAAPPTPTAPATQPAAAAYEVDSLKLDWVDKARERTVPVKIYFPKTGQGPFPVIVFSHGLGGSRDGYRYLGEYWASHGYVSVHPQHVGSDSSLLTQGGQPMEAMRAAAADPRNAINRVGDVNFVLDQLAALNTAPGPLQRRLDLANLGMAGHSFGANTTMLVCGQTIVRPMGGSKTIGDARIKAAIPMSAPVPGLPRNYDEMFGSISMPMMHMTGTLDASPIGATTAAQRRIPFDHSKNAPSYLVTFEGGDHMIFSGRPRAAPQESDAVFQSLICQATTAFWDANLKGDKAATAWLSDGGLAKALGAHARLEARIPQATQPAK